jgi:rRNA maturation endonuclease Nob1
LGPYFILTRAYFTAATCATSLFKTPGKALFNYKVENSSPQFLSNYYFNLKRNTISIINAFSLTRQIQTDLTKDLQKSKLIKENTALIIWNDKNNNSFRLQKGILTKIIRDTFSLSNYHKSIIIGVLLSDGHIQKRVNWNPRISLKQSFKNFEYLWSIFNSLSVYCSSYPYLTKTIKRGKLIYSTEFITRQLKSFNEIYNLFYLEEDSRLKSITPELYHYLDYICLAHWIQGDGAKRNKGGIVLCTDCFSVKEVVLLMNILLIKFNIKSTIHVDNGKPRIYINKVELDKFKHLIKPYFVNSFLYKISN